MKGAAGLPAATPVLGVPVQALSMAEALDHIVDWAREAGPRTRRVCFVNAHSAVTATRDAAHAEVLRGADLNLPDGAPVAWMLRRLGHPAQARVSGPDVMEALLERCARAALPVYLLGGTPHTLSQLRQAVTARWPTLPLAGAHAPAFEAPSADTLAHTADTLSRSGARVVFVGLGCPKQEWWMARLAEQRPAPAAVLLGVGAAFDFLAGTQRRAPGWMRQSGLEWLHRLAQEPRRLAARYLGTNLRFAMAAWRQLRQLQQARRTSSARTTRDE